MQKLLTRDKFKASSENAKWSVFYQPNVRASRHIKHDQQIEELSQTHPRLQHGLQIHGSKRCTKSSNHSTHYKIEAEKLHSIVVSPHRFLCDLFKKLKFH